MHRNHSPSARRDVGCFIDLEDDLTPDQQIMQRDLEIEAAQLQDAIDRFGIEGIVESADWAAYEVAIARMQRATAALTGRAVL